MKDQTCGKCKVTKPLGEFYPDKSKRLGVHGTCKECIKADRRARYEADPDKYKARMRAYAATPKAQADKKRRYAELRDAAFAAYGNECACCGERELAFLTIDHVGGWGNTHRREGGSAYNMYHWLKQNDYPQDGTIQLLCWNCNCAMGIRGGCPHQARG